MECVEINEGTVMLLKNKLVKGDGGGVTVTVVQPEVQATSAFPTIELFCKAVKIPGNNW